MLERGSHFLSLATYLSFDYILLDRTVFLSFASDFIFMGIMKM